MSSRSDRFVHLFKSFFSMHEGRASYKVIRERIVAGSRIDGIHICLLVVAMLIASIGLNVDSTEAIIGSMLICPLMGSVLAIAYSVATMDNHLLKKSFFGLVLQVGLCLATSTLYFVISPISNTTSELLTNTSPTVWDLLIALAGGFAGGIGNSRKQEPSTLIAGVAVATALMPPLCAAGYALSMRNLADFLLAIYEFSLNVVFIAFGAELVLLWIHVPAFADLNNDGIVTKEELEEVRRRSSKLRTRLVLGTLAFMIPCILFSMRVVNQSTQQNGDLFENKDRYDVALTSRELEVVCPGFLAYSVGVEDSYDTQEETLAQRTVATITTGETLGKTTRKTMELLVRVHVPEVDEVNFVEDTDT
ncbi:MAG: DUF389 domain-containing protein [Coriobacteriales bacterium]|nr:DUF389 domain-containing protein [Coriobacteriales bacterium]